MRIALLGSFFNPPHLGHILVAQQVLDFAGVEEVWFLVANKSTLGKEPITLKHRLAMVKLIDMTKVKISQLEIDYKLSGNTIEITPILKKDYPEHEFIFIIGSDQLPDFHKWGSYKQLLKQMKFLVVPRPGYPVKPLYQDMAVLNEPQLVTINLSSSLIRDRVKKELPIDNFVPEKVKEYIIKNKLYKS